MAKIIFWESLKHIHQPAITFYKDFALQASYKLGRFQPGVQKNIDVC